MTIKTFCCNCINPIGVTEPVFSWKISNCDDKKQIAYQITVCELAGECVWNSGKVNNDDSAYIKYGGSPLKENTKYCWQVTIFTQNYRMISEEAYFVTGLFDTESLQWISADSEMNSPLIYKEFDLNNVHEYSTVNVCGLGFFELYINGKKVSEDLMNPVRTDYDAVEYKNLKYPYENITQKSVQYLNYEVSKYLKKGKNNVAVWLGNGWYRQRDRIVEGTFDYGEELKMFFKLTNGHEIIKSDGSWLCAESPIVYDNLFYGEVYDARIKNPRYADGSPVHIVSSPVGKLVPQLCSPERIVETLVPRFLESNIYDSGLCLSGFAEIICSGNAGDKVDIYYAEEKDSNDDLDFSSTTGYEKSDKNQIQKDTYILNGSGKETYVPRFVWHSFRYLKLSFPESVKIKKVKVHRVHSDLKQRTKFKCSNDLLNEFHSISLNTCLSNVHGCVPMDCAHRERLGYTGDGQLSSLSMMYNLDAYHLYNKWINDILDAQNQKNGFVPHTAPFNGGGGGPAWGSSIAVVPWNMYMQYGDTEILKKCKNRIRKWIEYLSDKKENGLVTHEENGSWCLGDWCMPSKYPWSEPHIDEIKIPSELVNTIYYIYCIDIYCKILNVLNEEIDQYIINEREEAVNAVNDTFLCEEYVSGEQGCNVFPLFAGIVPAKREYSVLEKMIRRIEENSFCFDTGISGTRFLFIVLDMYGRNDIALKMLLNTKYPSYGNMIEKGATALWETWEGNGAKNHTAFLSADSWLFYGLAGIKPNGGYKEFFIKPFFTEKLDNLDVKLECEYGEIALNWERCNKGIEVNIKIPFNTTAHIDLNGDCFDLESGTYKYHIGGKV